MKRKIGVLLSICCLIFVSTFMPANVKAAETTSEEGGNLVKAEIVPMSLSQTGAVVGNGVRLRAEPNTSSTVLELMYFGESVMIDLDKSTLSFYYIRRDSTGTCGYASTQYIQFTESVR